MAPLCLVHVLTQRKKDGCQWGFSQTWIFFQKGFFFSQHLGPDAFSAVRGQWIRAKNIKDIKEHFSKLLELQTFLYSIRAQHSAFLTQKISIIRKTTAQRAYFNSNLSIHNDYFIHFSSFIQGGSHEDEIAILTRKSNSR